MRRVGAGRRVMSKTSGRSNCESSRLGEQTSFDQFGSAVPSAIYQSHTGSNSGRSGAAVRLVSSLPNQIG
jgi:hypothetical protein